MTTKAIRDILDERQRQVEVEGFDLAHDRTHQPGTLSEASMCYTEEAVFLQRNPSVHSPWPAPPVNWPWDFSGWKPVNARTSLVKAAALIIAEIERIDLEPIAELIFNY